MNTVLSLIVLIRQNNLRIDNNYLIADYLIKNILNIENISIQEISDSCHMSTNTILRFCNLLGFKTYKSFKNNLITTIKTRKLQMSDKNQNILKDDLIKPIIDIFYDDIDLNNWQTNLNKIVEVIHKYKTIHLYGATFPLALAQSFIEDMALLGIDVKVHQTTYDIQTVDEIGLSIIISYSGRFMEGNANLYKEILNQDNEKILVSHLNEHIGNVDYLLQIPNTKSAYYDDLLMILILDYILLSYY